MALSQNSPYPVIKIINLKLLSNDEGFIKNDTLSCIEKPIIEVGFVSDIKFVKLNNFWALIVCSNSCIFSFFENGDNMTKYLMEDYENCTDLTTVYTGISARDNYLFIGSDNGSIIRFELISGCSMNPDNIKNKVVILNLPSPVTCLEIHGVNLFCGTDIGTLLNIDYETKITVSKSRSPLALNQAMITVLKKLDDKYILGGLSSGAIFIYDISKDECVLSLSNHTKEVTSIDGYVDNDGVSYLIGTGSEDGVVTLFKWNPSSKQVENTFCRNIMEKSVIGLHL